MPISEDSRASQAKDVRLSGFDSNETGKLGNYHGSAGIDCRAERKKNFMRAWEDNRLQTATTTEFLTIVSGLPRSGTSMMMRMLETGGIRAIADHLRTADVDNPRGYYEFEPAKKTKEDPSWVPGAVGGVVKMVYQLLYDLPPKFEYRVLFMSRKMEEVLQSQRKMLDRLGKAQHMPPDEEMARMFQMQLKKFRDWVAAQPNFKMIDVVYHELVADPSPHIERINTFLGGHLNTQAMREVVEPELYRNRA